RGVEFALLVFDPASSQETVLLAGVDGNCSIELRDRVAGLIPTHEEDTQIVVGLPEFRWIGTPSKGRFIFVFRLIPVVLRLQKPSQIVMGCRELRRDLDRSSKMESRQVWMS